ncbi:hypothetical protein GCM10010266_53190 [Streptomyces griseomycini]|uniref:DNA primase family protein n=1 Tax=Streptomyces griseomycini TaxID=66895 RepID=UPI0018758544|nr:phage/plasmid primase, P4 family [Streptomyces griseomycini]GGQ23303.1 hypothetical protein GCM10010266_53190 [Streptomyces griseomycini]
MFDDAYWQRAEKLLNVRSEVRHANIAAFIAEHCADQLRYVESLGWYRWTGFIWQPTGDDGAALQAITDATDVLIQRMREDEDSRSWAAALVSKMLSGRERGYIVKEMSALRAFRSTIDDFDAARHLLTFQNGTVDLRTGELKPHDPADMQTIAARVDYVPDAPCPRWLQFLDEIFPGDVDLQGYFQKWLGLCITGEVRDHVLGVWYGEKGRNGKGTTVRTMHAAFGGDVIVDVPFELFQKSRIAPHEEQIASLRSARMVVAQEGESGKAMDVTRLKNYTGGDRITARKLRQSVFRFDPKFTLVLVTNELPEFAAGGAALWARTKAILFGESFIGREDRTLEPTIQGPEREGFAAWVVEGAKRYYAEGLIDPVSVEAATQFHKEQVDPLRPLIGELFVYDDDAEPLPRSEFNAALKKWRDDNGDTSAKFKPNSVHKEFERQGIKPVKVKGTFVLRGIRLLPQFGGDPMTDHSGNPGFLNPANR